MFTVIASLSRPPYNVVLLEDGRTVLRHSLKGFIGHVLPGSRFNNGTGFTPGDTCQTRRMHWRGYDLLFSVEVSTLQPLLRHIHLLLGGSMLFARKWSVIKALLLAIVNPPPPPPPPDPLGLSDASVTALKGIGFDDNDAAAVVEVANFTVPGTPPPPPPPPPAGVSISSLSRSSGIATVNAPGHGLVEGDSFTISGASPSTFNGDGVVNQVIDANSFNFSNAGGNESGTGGTVVKTGHP